MHDSGAERALVVDLADSLEVRFAPISEATHERLADLLEPGLEPANPLDVWGTGSNSREVFAGTMLALARDDSVAAVALCLDLYPEFGDDDETPLAVSEVLESTSKPVAVMSNLHSSIDQAAAARIRAAGVPVLEGTRTGLLALKHLLEWRDRPAPVSAEPLAGLDAVRRARWLGRLASGSVSGAEAFALLAAYGIAAVPAVAVTDRAAAIEAAGSIGYPVVLKTDEPAIAHKSDVGGVMLGLASEAEVAAAFEELAERLGKRVLVAATAPDGVEVALGVVRDPGLGPLVVVAAGGVLVELMSDRVVALPPIDRDRARRLIDRISVRRLLDGARGQAAADLDAVVDAVASVSILAEELGNGLEALDVNPLRCGPFGVVALDALVVARRDAGPSGAVALDRVVARNEPDPRRLNGQSAGRRRTGALYVPIDPSRP